MQYKRLGSTDLMVSEVAFGGVEIGMPYGLNMAQAHKLMHKNDAIKLLHKSLDEGINFYDTARLYGQSEAIMGEAFVGRRNHIVLASKCRHFRLPDGSLPNRKELRGIVYQSLQESLVDLKTDYIDVFMLHYADLEILEIDELYEIFADLQREGIIGYPGVSVYEPSETKLALDKNFWKVIQLPFNLMDQKHGTYFNQAKQQGVGIIVRSVLMRGLLTDKSFNLHPALKDVQDHIQQYVALFDQHVTSLPALAMKFVASFPEVSSVLVGIDKEEYLEEALALFNGHYLEKEKCRQAAALSYPDQSFLNLSQWDKNGWL